ASNIFHAERLRTTLPTLALVLSSPLATRVLTPSRSTGRETPKRRISSASPGNFAPSGYWPVMMSMPRMRATSARLDMARGARDNDESRDHGDVSGVRRHDGLARPAAS